MYSSEDIRRLREVLGVSNVRNPDTDWSDTGIRLLTDDVVSSLECRVCVLDGQCSRPPPQGDDQIAWLHKRFTRHKLVREQFPLLQPLGGPGVSPFFCEYSALALVLHDEKVAHWSLLVLYIDVAIAALSTGHSRRPTIHFQHMDSVLNTSSGHNLSLELAQSTAERFTRDFLVRPDQDVQVQVEEVRWNYQTDGRNCGLCVGTFVSLLTTYTSLTMLNVDEPTVPAQVLLPREAEDWDERMNELQMRALKRLPTIETKGKLAIDPNPLEWARMRLQRGTRCLVLKSPEELVQRYISNGASSASEDCEPTVETVLSFREVEQGQIWYLHRPTRRLCIYQPSPYFAGYDDLINTAMRSLREARLPLPMVVDGFAPTSPIHPLWAYRLMTYLAVAGLRRPFLSSQQASALINALPRHIPAMMSEYEHWVLRPVAEPLAPLMAPRSLLLTPMFARESMQPHKLVLVCTSPALEVFYFSRQKLWHLSRSPAAAQGERNPLPIPTLYTVSFSVTRQTVLLIVGGYLQDDVRNRLYEVMRTADTMEAPDYSFLRLPWHNATWLLRHLLQ